MNKWYPALNCLVREAIKKSKAIIICPFGENGILTKELLNWSYGVEEVAIADNGLAKYNPSVLHVEDLRKIDVDGLAVILNATDQNINQILENQIKNLGLNIEIYNILNPLVVEAPEKESYFQMLKKLLQVKKVRDKRYIRVGGDNDGAYIMLDAFQRGMRAYSFGIGSNVTWDLSMAECGIDVFMYDHTISGLPVSHDMFHFQRYGVASQDKPKKRLFSLDTLLKNNGDEENYDLILKMDVEGAEWEVFDSVETDILERFSQITLELHGMADQGRQAEIIRVLEKLNRTHQAVWLHGNNASYAERAGDIMIPSLLEVTYVRKKDFQFYESSCTFPLDIDMPNIKEKKDFELGEWG